MGVALEEIIESSSIVEEAADDPIYAHIIDRGDSPRSAMSLLFEARVNGTPVTALCGHTWVPSRDPRDYPLCSKCKEIFEFAADFRGVL